MESGLRSGTLAALLIAVLAACAPKVDTDRTDAAPGAAEVVSPPTLDRQVAKLVGNAVFEVVRAKPKRDPLEYERELPVHLIPYAVRSDDYISVGTAFAIGPERFVTAAHVMGLGYDSQYGPLRLRDRHGRVYPLDVIERYSGRRDVVEFTAKGLKAERWLEVNGEPALNEPIYAVGNALGEGIVIRGGLYTSRTPEEREGAWHWMRFSAAASPGNSGGPLLDERGRVVGIVLRKSANENLNYALPVTELRNLGREAVIHERMQYRMDTMQFTESALFERRIPLPRRYEELHRRLAKLRDDFGDDLFARMMREHRDDVFPRGAGSARLLHDTVDAPFPHVIGQGEDGTWSTFYPRERSTGKVGEGGTIEYGTIGVTEYFRLEKPRAMPLERLLTDPETFMETYLRGRNISRRIGNEKIRITSLGRAREVRVHEDGFGRKWLVRTWPIPYSDRVVVAFILPTPDGCVGMVRAGQTFNIHSHVTDLEALTDFFYISYYATFGEWKEFLALKSLLPATLADKRIEMAYGDHFTFDSKYFSLEYGPELLRITERSDMRLRYTYFREGEGLVWDVSAIVTGDDEGNMKALSVSRTIEPRGDVGEKVRNRWGKLVSGSWPYTGEAFSSRGRTLILDVAAPPKGAPARYALFFGDEGQIPQNIMTDALDALREGVTIHE